MARRTAPQASFDDQLVLFRYFLHELRIDSLDALGEKLNSIEYEGVNESGNTYFCEYIARISKMKGAAVTPEKLRLYDENICRHTRQIGEKRGSISPTYTPINGPKSSDTVPLATWLCPMAANEPKQNRSMIKYFILLITFLFMIHGIVNSLALAHYPSGRSIRRRIPKARPPCALPRKTKC